MYTSNQIADYIIFRLNSEEEGGLSNLKLQKLLYYTQVWYLVFYGAPLFDGKFQAWIHGPVNREIYDRFKDKKYLYSPITPYDIIEKNFVENIPENVSSHIDSVLEVYAPYSATDLEIMTHREDPWIQARKGYSPIERCVNNIDESVMVNYYKKRIEN